MLKALEVWQDYAVYGPLLTTHEALILDENVRFLVSVIEGCIAREGEANVLIAEPWITDDAYNLVDEGAFLPLWFPSGSSLNCNWR